MTRPEIEAGAQANVCACYFFDFADSIEHMTDQELVQIIENSQACHYQQQLHQPVSVDEFIQLLQDCPDYKTDEDIDNAHNA